MKLFSNLEEYYTYEDEDFGARLLRSTAWDTDMITSDSFTVYAKTSVGVGFINNTPLRIKVNLQTFLQEDGLLRVLISTKLRLEHYIFFVAIAAVCVIIPLTLKDKAWVVIWPLILWAPFHIFFQFIFRVQEEMLASKIVQKLKLKALPE